MISKKEYIELHKSFKNRQNTGDIFTLSISNTESVKKEAEILSNKAGFSGNNTINGFEQTEINGWSSDFALDGDLPDRLIGIVYNNTLQKFVVFRGDSTKAKVKIYTVEDNFSYTLQSTLTLSSTILSGAREVLYSEIADEYYLIGNGASSRLSMYIIESDFTLGSYYNLTSGTAVRGGIGINETTGHIFFTDGFGSDTFEIFNPFTGVNVSVTSIPSVAGGYALKGVVYDDVNDKYFMITQGTPTSEIFSVDETTLAVTKIHEYDYNSKGILSIVDNKLFVVIEDSSGNQILQKFDLVNETLISSRQIQKVATTPFFLTDSKKNFYLAGYSDLAGYDKDGDLIFNFKNTVGTNWVGGNAMTVQAKQFFNTKNNTFGLNGVMANGSLLVITPKFVGGLNEFDLTSSSSSYASANTDFNINPISVSQMTLIYKNGGVSLNNPLKYSYGSATGKVIRKFISPRSHIKAEDFDSNIVEIKFEQPIIIDSKHFFQVEIEPNETLTFAFYYKQANISEILNNKFFLK